MREQNTTQELAVYTSDEDNPYLAAMPELLKKDDFLLRIRSLPVLPADMSDLSGETRRKLLSGLADLFLPMDYMYMIYDLIYRAIQTTYRTKTVVDSIRQIGILRQGRQRTFATQAQSGAILGVPGVGKTSTVRRCLAQLPQVIEHRIFQGQAFYKKQILYLCVECPSDCSIKTLAYSIIAAVDRAIGSDYFQVISHQSRISASALTTQLKIICINHAIGLIVVDEIQNAISTAEKARRIKPLVTFLLELLNDTCTGVYFVGTLEADEVFCGHDHLKRRTRGLRLLPLRPDGTYRRFLETIWQYQFTLHRIALTDQIANNIYDHSGGIPAYIIQIFMEAQAQAIIGSEDVIDAKIVQRAINMLCISIPKTYPAGVSLSDFSVSVVEEGQHQEMPAIPHDSVPRMYATPRGRRPKTRDRVDLIELWKQHKQADSICKVLLSLNIGEVLHL